MIGLFFLSFGMGFTGAVVPGPLFVANFQHALAVGWTAAIWLITGHALAELLLLIGVRLGFGGALTRPAVTRVIGIIGGLVLFWFAGLMIFSPPPKEIVHGTALAVGALIGQGFLISIVHPYFYIWWGAVGIGLISDQALRHGPLAWPVFYIGHILADFTWYVAAALLVALGGHFLSPTNHHTLIVACGVIVALLGVIFIVRALRDINLAQRRKDTAEI